MPAILENHATYCWASSQLTLMTGLVPPPKPLSLTLGHPPTETQASQSANVTSNLDTAKGLAIVTECCGPSLL